MSLQTILHDDVHDIIMFTSEVYQDSSIPNQKLRHPSN